jgi:hypothetical protein
MLPAADPAYGADWYDRENPLPLLILLANPRYDAFPALMPSNCGGGVVSAELRSCCSEYPDATGDAEPCSLPKSRAESGGVWPGLGLLFMATKTEAASRSCTCWCLEIKSLDV